jgi:hypothetical protein
MTGYPNYNFAAFDEARDKLIALGYDVISPADVDRDSGFDGLYEFDYSHEPVCHNDNSMKEVIERDVAAILSIKIKYDGIILLPGWGDSKGAHAELYLAKWWGLNVYSYFHNDPHIIGWENNG